jgi:hypothetical protein
MINAKSGLIKLAFAQVASVQLKKPSMESVFQLNKPAVKNNSSMPTLIASMLIHFAKPSKSSVESASSVFGVTNTTSLKPNASRLSAQADSFQTISESALESVTFVKYSMPEEFAWPVFQLTPFKTTEFAFKLKDQTHAQPDNTWVMTTYAMKPVNSAKFSTETTDIAQNVSTITTLCTLENVSSKHNANPDKS